MSESRIMTFNEFFSIRMLISEVLILCFSLQLKAECTQVVTQFGENLSSWANSRHISNLHAMEDLCSKSPSFRIGNQLMASMADKNSLAKTDTYDWDNYIACLQKEVDNGLQIAFSNVELVPVGYVKMNYPGLQYVSCKVKVDGTSSYELRDLFILKNEKIVKITDYIEKVDEITGKKKIEVDYLELARVAFADGDYQKCYNLFKEGGLKKIKDSEKSGWHISDANIFPYIESCIALNDWDGAMFGFTRTMNRKYWVNGIEWKLNPEDIREWNKNKVPLMEKLLEKTYNYYSHDVALFHKSPLIRHAQQRTGVDINTYTKYAAQHFMQNRRSYADRVTAIKAAAEYGHIDAQRQIGKLYLSGYNTDKTKLEFYETMLPCDTVKSLFWLDKAALSGDIEAAKIAASFNLIGVGGERNEAKAFSYYSNYNENLDYDVQFGLGICHYYGLGTTQDEISALEFLIFAEDWHPDVPYLIAQIYLKKSDPRAIKYLNKLLQRKNVNDAIIHETLALLSDCNRYGKCGMSINIDEADRLEAEANKHLQVNAQWLQDFFVSLTKVNYENEPI